MPWARWSQSDWITTYTPVLTAATTNPTLGTGNSVSSIYTQKGDLVIYQFAVYFGTSGTNAGSGEYRISLPVTASAAFGSGLIGFAYMYDSSANRYQKANLRFNGTTRLVFEYGNAQSSPAGTYGTAAHNAPWAWAASDQLNGTAIYQTA